MDQPAAGIVTGSTPRVGADRRAFGAAEQWQVRGGLKRHVRRASSGLGLVHGLRFALRGPVGATSRPVLSLVSWPDHRGQLVVPLRRPLHSLGQVGARPLGALPHLGGAFAALWR